MKILITGSSGMLGSALSQELSAKYEVVGLDIRRTQKFNFIKADITQRDETVEKIVSQRPNIIIHAAAYTDVDGCEQNPEKAENVNARGTETIAQASQESRALLFYISTDFVFDGEKESPYIESDKPNPINIYGKSKLDGERLLKSILKKFIIVRSSWLFGKGGRNFVDTLLKKAQNERKVEVVDDQFGAPTYTQDLVQAIDKLIGLMDNAEGIYHISNSGSCSRYEFAQAMGKIAGLKAEIVPISTEQYHSLARRPKMSILENRRYQECTGTALRHWQEALKEYLLERN